MNIADFYPIFLSANAVTIDSRKINKDDIFFAFSGENFNGATMAENAVENGAKAVIVEDKNFENVEKNIFFVPSTLEFLQNLARFHRENLTIPIIGLTGSNGKTTTKELIREVLEQKFRVQSTVGNLNNHIGVPLTLLSIKPEHEIAVVEMGANHQKEIELLCEIAKPTFGYITNFGKAHLEGFGGFEGVIKGKSEMYNFLKNSGGTILVNENDPLQTEKVGNYFKKITFGKPESNYYFEEFSVENKVGVKVGDTKIQSNLTGNYNFSNISAAISLGKNFGVTDEQAKTAIENYYPTNMRSQILEKNGQRLILDTYNANPSSMEAALKNFETFQGSKIAILGDMLELGDESKAEHQRILNLAKSLEIQGIYTVGKNFAEVNDNGYAWISTEEFYKFLQVKPIISDTILIKGSRGIGLEKILEAF